VSNATLVICPARLCAQWEDELYKLISKDTDIRVHTISTIVNYKKIMINLNDIVNTDIIFISTNIFNNDNYKNIVYGDSKDDTYYKLTDIKWKRIIFDEGHEILFDRARSSKISIRTTYDEVMALKGKYKWICSGTPLPYGVDSFNSIIKYLSNFDYKCNKNNLDQETVNTIIKKNFRMNTKESVKGQIFIPKINEKTILLTQTPIEKNMYLNASGDNLRMIQLCTNILVSEVDNSILGDDLKSLEDVQTKMINYFDNEINEVNKKIKVFKNDIIDLNVKYDNYDEFPKHSDQWKQGLNNIKSKISYRKETIKKYKDDILHLEARRSLFTTLQTRVKEVVTEPCPICYDVINKVTLTKCSHIFCEDCIRTYIKGKSTVECPMCRTQLNVKKDIGFSIDDVEDEETNVQNSDEYKANLNKWGTKMAYLIKLLKLIIQKSEDNRIIIFSQWNRMLQLVGSVLDENSIKNVYLKGNIHVMSKNIRNFKRNKDIRVIMLSSDTCCSGSNLTEASHIILLDTVNGNKEHAKAVEEQAIGRAARLGQMKNVEVFRLIMKETIEEEYYNLNVGKRVKYVKSGNDKQLDNMFGKTTVSHLVV
jgi:SNF2 family DNA or RNA helicase